MKPIQQLLELAQNPYYKFTADERAVLDDFLSHRAVTATEAYQPKRSKSLSKKPNVRVRNIVKKTDTYPPEAS